MSRDDGPGPPQDIEGSDHVDGASRHREVGRHGCVRVAVAALVEAGHWSSGHPVHNGAPEVSLLAESVQEQDGRPGTAITDVFLYREIDAGRAAEAHNATGPCHRDTVVRGRP
jgi:hypothetical protein